MKVLKNMTVIASPVMPGSVPQGRSPCRAYLEEKQNVLNILKTESRYYVIEDLILLKTKKNTSELLENLEAIVLVTASSQWITIKCLSYW